MECSSSPQELGQRAVRRVAVRLMPFLLLLYLIAYLDRANVSYAGLRMTRDLGFSDRVFGLGAGLFFGLSGTFGEGRATAVPSSSSMLHGWRRMHRGRRLC